MSADYMRKQSKQGNHGQVILPQAISDPSIIESVAGFIHEVVPQAYSSVLPSDGILWARFECIDYNDPENYPQLGECESESTVPLLLVLGYSSGVQVWSIGGSGEATELLSWCQGSVRALRFLLKPSPRDPHSSKRPLVAIVDSSSQFFALSFISLKTAEVVKTIKFTSPICDVHCNRKSIVITLNERIAVFDSATLEDRRLTITTCYLSPGNSPNPIALGTRWLAYGEKKVTTWQRSSGGCEGDGVQSYTSAVIHAAKSLRKGLRELGGSLTGSTQSSQNAHAQPGLVSVIDIERKGGTSEEERGNMIAHFVAHTSAVVAMAFDPSGLILITADRHGHSFNVFRIHPHPCTSQLAAVHHLYILHRGETTARVQDIAVSWDSRWVTVSSVRGTTHLFPITPYGGLVTVRTHTTSQVVNRLSRFEKSAGLRDGRGSPLPCEVPPTPPPPRLPPYPHPSIITPLAQLRARPDDPPLAATFGPPRAWLPGQPKSKRTCSDSLYVISTSGTLLQYDLDPKCVQGIAKEKISYDTAIEVGVEAKAEWVLPKPPYTSSLCPPLPPGHVLLDLPPSPRPLPDQWLSQVEIITHTGPHRRLWMGPQFTFKCTDPLPSSGRGEEEVGIDSGSNPLRSNPVNMPHRPYHLIETSSGGSVGSPQNDTDEAGGRLKEDLADAMLETQFGSCQARGKLRRAEVEWQVNPLGAVQTHPVAVAIHRPHPIFYETFPVDITKEGQVVSTITQDSVINKNPSQTSSDTTLSTVQFENVKKDPYEKYLMKPTSSGISSSKSNCDDKITIFEPPVEKKLDNLKCLIDSSSKDTDKCETNFLVSKLESVNETSVKDQPEISSSNKEGTIDVEKNTVKLQETEEKSLKVISKKGKKKRNSNDKKIKKDLSKSPSDENNSGLLSESFLSHKVEEKNKNVAEDIKCKEMFKNTEEKNSKLVVIEEEINVECNIVDESTLNTAVSSAEIQLSPNQEVQLEFVKNRQPKEEIISCSIIDLQNISDCNEVHSVFAQEINLDSAEVVIDATSYNVPVDIDENSDKIINTDNYTGSKVGLGETDCQNSTNFDAKAINSIIEEEIELNTSEIIPEEASQRSSETESDMNGNKPLKLDFQDKDNSEELFSLEISVGNGCTTASNDQNYETETSETIESLILSVEDSSEINVTPSVKPSRNSKNKKRKKEKKILETSQLVDITETDISGLSFTIEKEITTVEVDKNYLENISISQEIKASTIETNSDVSELVINPDSTVIKEEKENLQLEAFPSVEIQLSGLEDSIKSLSPISDVPLLFSEDIQSDQIASTDRSEVEDISSYSGKESDDAKVITKERSRKQKSESCDKDRNENKKKSPSPATAKTETKDSESSDESCPGLETKMSIPKVPKRKKGKKNDENITEVQLKGKEDDSVTVKVLTEEPKDKSSDSSNEYSLEKSIRKQTSGKSWSAVVNSRDQHNNIEDRDSVYESCNDDGASDSLAFESSKEDFDEAGSKVSQVEATTSSVGEEKNDSGDKVVNQQIYIKKLKKQKKKKR